MSDEATLDDFLDGLESVPESSIKSSLDETAVGDIPSDWKVTRLGDIALEREYGLTESAEEYDPDKPRYIRTQDFDDFGGLKDDSLASLSWDKAEGGLLEEGDMLFARSGSVGASLGKIYLYDPDHGPCCYGGYSIRHRLQEEGLNHQYIEQFALSERYWDWIRRRAKTTAQSNINTGEYGSLPLPIPPLEEQRKIASVLHNVDQAIQKIEDVIKQIERIKAGTSHDLFHTGVGDDETKRAWMGEIPKTWEVNNFSTIVARSQNGIYKEESEYGGKHPIIKMGDIFEGAILERPISQSVHLTDDNITKYGTQEGDLVFARHAQAGWGAGDCTYVPDLDVKAVVESNMVHVQLDSGVIPLFYAQYFNSEMGVNSMKRIVTRGNIKSISQQDLLNLKVPIPPKKEQNEIANILTNFDELVSKSEEELYELQQVKQALMQDLLSGDVRTTDAEIEVLPEVAQHG